MTTYQFSHYAMDHWQSYNLLRIKSPCYRIESSNMFNLQCNKAIIIFFESLFFKCHCYLAFIKINEKLMKQ